MNLCFSAHLAPIWANIQKLSRPWWLDSKFIIKSENFPHTPVICFDYIMFWVLVKRHILQLYFLQCTILLHWAGSEPLMHMLEAWTDFVLVILCQQLLEIIACPRKLLNLLLHHFLMLSTGNLPLLDDNYPVVWRTNDLFILSDRWNYNLSSYILYFNR